MQQNIENVKLLVQKRPRKTVKKQETCINNTWLLLLYA